MAFKNWARIHAHSGKAVNPFILSSCALSLNEMPECLGNDRAAENTGNDTMVSHCSDSVPALLPEVNCVPIEDIKCDPVDNARWGSPSERCTKENFELKVYELHETDGVVLLNKT